MGEISYYNGELMRPEDVRVPWNDRGNVFGDGVYEVAMAYGGKIPLLDRHMKRLENSLFQSKIEGVTVEGIQEIILDLYARAEMDDAMVYLQISRGCTPTRSHTWNENLKPTVLIHVFKPKVHAEECYTKGIKLVSAEDLRWGRCDIKTLQLMWNAMAKQQAMQKGGYEVLMLKGDRVIECAASSALMVKDEVVFAPPAGREILPSITRAVVLEGAEKLGIEVKFEWKTYQQFCEADEVFLTGTTVKVMPVRQIDDFGIKGEFTISSQLSEAYESVIHSKKG